MTKPPDLRITRVRRRRRVLAAVAVVLGASLVAAAAIAVAWQVHRQRAFEAINASTGGAGLAALLVPEERAAAWTLLVLDGLPPSSDGTVRSPDVAVAWVPADGSEARLLDLGTGTSLDDSGTVVPLWQAERADVPTTVALVERTLGIAIDHFVLIDCAALGNGLDAEAVPPLELDAGTVPDGSRLTSSDALNDHLQAALQAQIDAGLPALRDVIIAVARLAPGDGLRFPDFRLVDSLPGWLKTDLGARAIVSLGRALAAMEPSADTMAVAPAANVQGRRLVDASGAAALAQAMQAGQPLADVLEPGSRTPASSISVTVLNGAGREGVAAQAAAVLRAAGYDVRTVGNANQFVYDSTLVVYRDQKASARAVLADLPVGRLVPSRGMYSFVTDVLVMVGKDWP